MTGTPYTACPSPTLDALLDHALAQLAKDIDTLHLPKLAAVVLGGGYGRGEGGVLHTPEGDRLYNDLDFFVFARQASRRELASLDMALANLAPKWEERLKVAIDFGPAKNLSDLSKVAATLMYQELLRGWKPVAGKINLAGLLPALEPAKLPVTEAIRLLLNRGMGLLMAGDKLSRGDGDQDFIVRNMHKSLLGSGDALLLAAGQYAWRSEERLEKFRELAAAYELPGEFVAGYREACQYKLEPTPYLPQNPWEFLRQCQRCWLRAVQITASAEDSSPEAVMEGLHRSARRHSSFRQFLRWTIRARAFRKPRFSCDQPVVTVLGMLYPTLLTAPPPAPPILPELFRLWQLFN